MEPLRQAEEINLINSLNLYKAVGHDNVSPYLCYLFDYAFKLEIFPQC